MYPVVADVSGVSMTGQFKSYSKAAIAYFAVLLSISASISASISTAIAQGNPALPPLPKTTPLPSPDPPPPMTTQEAASMQKFVKEEIRDSKEVGDRIQQEVDRTFGWTLSLLNTLITVLIAIPILTGLAAFWLRRSILGQVVQDIRKELELVREELKIQAARDLKDQLATFKHELEAAKSGFTTQLQTLSITAQQEKDRIFQELAKITPSIIQEEFVAPEIHQRIQELTDQLDFLKSHNAQLLLSASDYLKQGDACYLERRLEDAISSYEKALNLNPNLVDAWLAKAKALRRLKRYEESIAANNRAIQIQPENPSGWFGKGYALTEIQKYEEADVAYAQAIKLNPDRSIFWRHHAFVLIKLGKSQEAWFCLEKALELAPDSGSNHYTRALYYASQTQIESALQSLSEALKLRPTQYEYSQLVLADPAFDSLRTGDRFQQLINASETASIAHEQSV
jgi:tetratricopeptide (TPR) repeat protein